MISTSAKLASFWSYRRSLQRCSRSAITKGGATRHRPDAYGRTEESPPIGREARAATLYSVGSARDPDHEAADALRRRSSETTGPFSVRHEGHASVRRVGDQPDDRQSQHEDGNGQRLRQVERAALHRRSGGHHEVAGDVGGENI